MTVNLVKHTDAHHKTYEIPLDDLWNTCKDHQMKEFDINYYADYDNTFSGIRFKMDPEFLKDWIKKEYGLDGRCTWIAHTKGDEMVTIHMESETKVVK